MKAVPEDAPFVVRPSVRRFAFQTIIGAVMVVGGLVLCFAYLPAGLILALPGTLILSLSVTSLRHREALLAADEKGIVLQAQRGPDGVRTLRWNEIERVFVHRVSRQFRLLCILPRDVERELRLLPGRRAGMEKSMRVCGAPYSVNLVAAGLDEKAAGAALRPLAAGRTQVDLPG